MQLGKKAVLGAVCAPCCGERTQNCKFVAAGQLFSRHLLASTVFLLANGSLLQAKIPSLFCCLFSSSIWHNASYEEKEKAQTEEDLPQTIC